MILQLLDNGDVRVNMGVPEFVPENIPFDAESTALQYSLALDARNVEVSVVSIGNPHAVILVDNVDTAAVLQDGPMIEVHSRFPQKVNAGFMQVCARDAIRLRVFERGVGETLGCGSGACAAVVCGIRLGLLDAHAEVRLPGGSAWVSWAGEGEPVYLSGPAHTVFAGAIELQPKPQTIN